MLIGRQHIPERGRKTAEDVMISSQVFRRWRTALAIGMIVALSSEIYLHFFVDDFRVSPAVILFPVLLVTLGLDTPVLAQASVTSLLVLVNRFLIQRIGGTSQIALIFPRVIPGAMFYLTYGLVFLVLEGDRWTARIPRTAAAAAAADFLSNVFEVLVREQVAGLGGLTRETLAKLVLIAAVRGALVAVILLAERWYRLLVVREEHEKRYRRLFMLTTSLKGEIYLMRKNTEQVESVMGNAYRLYEELKNYDLPPEVSGRSLDIARQVHEIKKDYFRIIQGIEEEIGQDPGTLEMKFSDLTEILLQTARTTIAAKKLEITIHCESAGDFLVTEHYELMSILNNLVNNAIEAIESGRKAGHILITEEIRDGNLLLSVRDDGPGISARHLKNIFQMGYSTKFDPQTGNIFRGVGLCGVKNQVEEHFGGTITVESEPGVYTLFSVRIPEDRIVAGKQDELGKKGEGGS